MSFELTVAQICKTTDPFFGKLKKRVEHLTDVDRLFSIDVVDADLNALEEIKLIADKLEDKRTVMAINSIIKARSGSFDSVVPNFKAFEAVLKIFLQKNIIDGWIYVKGKDDMFHPELVHDIRFISPMHRDSKPCVELNTVSISFKDSSDRSNRYSVNRVRRSYRFEPGDAVRRRVSDVLANIGVYKESNEQKDAYIVSLDRFEKLIKQSFAEQFVAKGRVHAVSNYSDEQVVNTKAVHDLRSEDYAPYNPDGESCLFKEGEYGAIPVHPVVRLFNLKTHTYFWMHSDNLTPYTYDKTLGDKLVLPGTHRDLLDVLTTDISAFSADFIDGKRAGNVILCKGLPGVGKTLTAEVYSELIERPLYSVHTGTLGTTASSIEKSLVKTFNRAKRWNAVLLLDEADVFVIQRKENIEQNAIVAEFLRTLEYFDGLLFMTTNRPNDIDEAIISRCAAIIGYHPPDKEDAAKIWKVMAIQFEQEELLTDKLISDLTYAFPAISPRDIKMLFRLAIRVAKSKSVPLDIDIFRQCAMFRAITMED